MIMYTRIKLLVLIYSFIKISSIFFLSVPKHEFFVTLFCDAYKVETWYTHGKWDDLLCSQKSSSQYILVLLFLFFFLSLQLANTKILHLQNCFIIPLMAMAGGMWALLTICYIYKYNRTHIITHNNSRARELNIFPCICTLLHALSYSYLLLQDGNPGIKVSCFTG